MVPPSLYQKGVVLSSETLCGPGLNQIPFSGRENVTIFVVLAKIVQI
jgi:hypothetical protein